MKRNGYLILMLLVGLMLLPACAGTPTLTEADEAEIYAAVIEQIYTVDDTFGGTYQADTVYVLTQTDDAVGDPESEQTASAPVSEATQQAVTLALDHLPGRITWVDDEAAVPIDASTGAVADNGVIVTLGNIHGQRDGTVQVASSIYVGDLAAGGQTYILEKVDGAWQVTGTTEGRWVS